MSLLIDTLATVMQQYAQGAIISPPRLAVPIAEGGVMLSMPASAPDIAIHKLVNVAPRNASRALPTIHGQVVACDAVTGALRFSVDGPMVTARRTAAVTLLGIARLLPHAPQRILLIGTGKQAAHHLEAIGEIHPHATVVVRGSTSAGATSFVQRHAGLIRTLCTDDGSGHEEADVVITLTTSKTPVYSAPGTPGRLVVGVGAFTADAAEISPATIRDSLLYVDDPAGAQHEAGDLIQAGVDWSRVLPLSSALAGTPDPRMPVVLKTVGCAAWDLAACRVIALGLG